MITVPTALFTIMCILAAPTIIFLLMFIAYILATGIVLIIEHLEDVFDKDE